MEPADKKAHDLLNRHVTLTRLRWHAYASEAVLRALARRLGQDERTWGDAGLLHDLDVEITRAKPDRHTLEAVKILRENGYPEEVVDAVRLHNECAHQDKRSTAFHHALAAGESIAGLIAFTAFVHSGGKLAALTTDVVLDRLAQVDFAPKVDRSIIAEGELLGITMREFVEIALAAMIEVADCIGL